MCVARRSIISSPAGIMPAAITCVTALPAASTLAKLAITTCAQAGGNELDRHLGDHAQHAGRARAVGAGRKSPGCARRDHPGGAGIDAADGLNGQTSSTPWLCGMAPPWLAAWRRRTGRCRRRARPPARSGACRCASRPAPALRSRQRRPAARRGIATGRRIRRGGCPLRETARSAQRGQQGLDQLLRRIRRLCARQAGFDQ